MTLLESCLFGTLILLMFGAVWDLYKQPPCEFFSPKVFFTVILGYYAVIGPLIFIARDSTILLQVDTRPVFWKGWLVSLLAYSSFLIGYRVHPKKTYGVTVVTHRGIAFFLGSCLFGCAAFAMLFWIMSYAGGLSYFIPSLGTERISTVGSETVLATYLLQCVNLTFGAASLLLLAYLQKRSKMTGLVLGLVLGLSILFFVKSGFRYRIAWLMVDLAATYYLWQRKRPNLWVWVPLILVTVGIMGFIGATRNYWAGLDTSKASGMSASDFMVNGFSESGTFMIVSQVVDQVPERIPHTYWEPLWVAVTAPIPRVWWPAKPDPKTLETLALAFGTPGSAEAGLAVPYFGEWYIAFGWGGVIVSSILMGYGFRRLWEWYKIRDRDSMAIMIYAVGLGFMYIMTSRGLLSMTLLNFSFSMLPLIFIYRLAPKKWFVDQRTLPKAPASRKIRVLA